MLRRKRRLVGPSVRTGMISGHSSMCFSPCANDINEKNAPSPSQTCCETGTVAASRKLLVQSVGPLIGSFEIFILGDLQFSLDALKSLRECFVASSFKKAS